MTIQEIENKLSELRKEYVNPPKGMSKFAVTMKARPYKTMLEDKKRENNI